MTDATSPLTEGTSPTQPSQAFRAELEQAFHACEVVRPFRRARYEPGHRVEYAISSVAEGATGRMVVEIEKFVGGGFAGQVYRVTVIEVESETPVAGLQAGGRYAIKILTPPSGFARVFRDFLYFLAYQGRFGAQVNPASVRVGVLWQKLIRRAAAARFGTERAVCDTFATFYDDSLHSFGEINEWIDGRIWKFEVDDRMFARWDFENRPPADHNCPEYVHKRLFMRELVALLHEMGASELARQYEWWTCKSQPNALKRVGTDASPGEGLTAVDFRAGLALLPFLPMSPADVVLILRGLLGGRLVQFDRSDPKTRRRFIEAHRAEFAGLEPAIDELERQESAHRSSLPDVTRQGFRLITDGHLRRSVRLGALTGWKNLGWLDPDRATELEGRRGLFALLYLISWVPLLGRSVIGLWGNARSREHLRRCLTSVGYLLRAMRASRIEVLIGWHRHGRGSDERMRRLVDRPVRYWLQRFFVGWLPATWHRAMAEPRFGWQRLAGAVRFVSDFLRVPAFRERWLLEEVRQGRDEGMLTPAEADHVSQQIKDPYIQKYLRCLAVHICTLPVTQIVMVLAGGAVVAYLMLSRHLSWAESLVYGTATAAAIQLAPISPGSITRGIFVIFLMIKERDVKNYYIAAPVSFIHVIGYLAFPLQMVGHDPALARFMAGRWARNLVGIVPVFGERGGLLEHGVFDVFFNLPISLRRGFRTDPLRYSVGVTLVLAAVALFGVLGFARLWEMRQPQVQLDNATVISIDTYHERAGGDMHWHTSGVRVRFDRVDGVVDFPAEIWNERIVESDRVDAVVRRCFFGNEYDGLAVSVR